MLVAVACFAVAWAMTAGVIDNANPATWGYAGLVFFAGSFVP